MHDTDQDDDDLDRDLPIESDMDDPDRPPLIACPYCRKMIHDQSEWCHHCGKYLSAEDVPSGVPKWIVIGTVLGLLAFFGGFLAWMFA